MSQAYLAFGANLGDRFQAWMFALSQLHNTPGCKVVGYSHLYETEPVGGPEQPMFLNGAIALETELSPESLLRRIQELEHQHGRTRDVHWGPRTLDLDILLYDDLVLNLEAPLPLVLPHPRMNDRRFVLQPLCDLASDHKHPTLGRTWGELLLACPDTSSVLPYRELSSHPGHEPNVTSS
ncbi:MAG: 2-amino-4-hydroxy-6-hydroxymethyldihydropteridine diphosphokinase [Deltaproteobacteria bacterium]|nr:MAG: 2-amino-4-hydroxy-6-hydroxymethyldihydropteridine diphosphokinase [Deltaproteobacteria bacterium]